MELRFRGELIMFWPIFIYTVLSVTFAITGGRNAGILVGLCIAGASLIALSAGAGLRASLRGPKVQKIGGILIACALLGLGVWNSVRFSVNLFGAQLSGWMWVAIGFVVCFVFGTREKSAITTP
jgi:hypothetical protein